MRSGKILIAAVFLVLIPLQPILPQFRSDGLLNLRFGLSFGTYTGGDFGSTYSLTFRQKDRYYYDNYYYSGRNYYEDDDETFYSPFMVDIGADFRINDFTYAGIEGSFIWHYNGSPAAEYTSGTLYNNTDYIDRWDNANLFAIPIFAVVRLYPLGRSRVPVYITGGYGYQYISESVERIREEYSGNYTYYGNYRYAVGYREKSGWLNGIKAGIGYHFNIGPYFAAETELKVTNFFPARETGTPFAMDRAKNITLIALSAKIGFSF